MGLDSGEVVRVAGIVASLAAAGGTVVAISHDAGFVAGSFERVVRLDAGRVVANTAAAEMLA
jgi:energy-coupling factor transporter ATP-binding protein EcfA2